MGFSILLPPKAFHTQILHSIGCIILHHFPKTYNLFFKISVPHKKTSGKMPNSVIFPEVVEFILTRS